MAGDTKTSNSGSDYVGQALAGAIEVAKIKAKARLSATPAIQAASLDAVTKPSDAQAKAESYTLAGQPWWVWAVGAVVLMGGIALVARK